MILQKAVRNNTIALDNITTKTIKKYCNAIFKKMKQEKELGNKEEEKSEVEKTGDISKQHSTDGDDDDATPSLAKTLKKRQPVSDLATKYNPAKRRRLLEDPTGAATTMGTSTTTTTTATTITATTPITTSITTTNTTDTRLTTKTAPALKSVTSRVQQAPQTTSIIIILDDYEKEANEVWELEQQEALDIEQNDWQYEQEIWTHEQQDVLEREQGTVQKRQQKEADKSKKRILVLKALVGVYFTGDGEQEPRSTVLAAIKCATKSIRVLMYTFTDKEIATKLANANKLGLIVCVLVDEDQSKLKQMGDCLTILRNAGVQVCNRFISHQYLTKYR